MKALEINNKIILPKVISSDSNIKEIKLVSFKKDEDSEIKMKTRSGENLIFVAGFQEIRTFPARPNLNYYDNVEKRIVKPSVMLRAHLKCIRQVDNLPR